MGVWLRIVDSTLKPIEESGIDHDDRDDTFAWCRDRLKALPAPTEDQILRLISAPRVAVFRVSAVRSSFDYLVGYAESCVRMELRYEPKETSIRVAKAMREMIDNLESAIRLSKVELNKVEYHASTDFE